MGEKSDGWEVKEGYWDRATVSSTGSNIQLVKGQSIVSLWTLCTTCNTTALLFSCHRDTEAGREEEELPVPY